jgi:hypothetical protein
MKFCRSSGDMALPTDRGNMARECFWTDGNGGRQFETRRGTKSGLHFGLAPDDTVAMHIVETVPLDGQRCTRRDSAVESIALCARQSPPFVGSEALCFVRRYLNPDE